MEHNNDNWIAGTTLSCDHGTFWHHGIADGKGGVIHNSKKYGKVVHESEQEFSEGRELQQSKIVGNDCNAAFQYALENVGQSYRLFGGNCENFVRDAHRLSRKSRQVGRHLFAAGAIGIAFIKGTHPFFRGASAALGVISLFDKNKDK